MAVCTDCFEVIDYGQKSYFLIVILIFGVYS